MDKKFCAFVFVISFVTMTTIVHGQNRSPSVDPIVEVDIEDVKKNGAKEVGFDFNDPAKTTYDEQIKSRTPANIVSNQKSTPPSNYLGPILFLITLPFAVWLIMAKKFSSEEVVAPEKNVEYFPKTYQFTPYKTEYQKPEEEDDDYNYPKAS